MKHHLFVGICLGLASVAVHAGEKQQLEDENAQINYSLGYQIGGDLKRQQVEVDREALLQGIEDALNDSEPAMNREAMHATLIKLKRKVMAQQRAEHAAEAKKNLEAGEAFLAANANKEGVVSLPSGLQYRVIEAGSGAPPETTDTVTVHYRGTLIDGTEFDSSYRRNQPASFRADAVVAGWREALPLMREGAKWELFLPARLAYGERGAGKIPANSTLIFEVELLSVDKNRDAAGGSAP
jgi:FKBP-type peptidyl-prolyl cis-trans isomerase FklB